MDETTNKHEQETKKKTRERRFTQKKEILGIKILKKRKQQTTEAQKTQRKRIKTRERRFSQKKGVFRLE